MRDTPTTVSPAPSSFPGELLIWLSPSFPIGSFAYSQGLEAAVEMGWVRDTAKLGQWIEAVVRHGAVHNDLILMSLIMRAEEEADIRQFAELAAAMQPSRERAGEALDQGRSFVAAISAGWTGDRSCSDVFGGFGPLIFPAALAIAARVYRLDQAATLEAYAIAFCNNLISAAIRLGVTGQFDGQRVMADLLVIVRQATAAARLAEICDLGSATFGADIASMFHETQTTRLFRS